MEKESTVRGLTNEEIDELNLNFSKNVAPRELVDGEQLRFDVNEKNQFVIVEQLKLEL